MNKKPQVLLLCASFILSPLHLAAGEISGPVYAAAINNCEIVKEITLTDEEVAAWQDVKSLEKRMDQIKRPLGSVEEQLSALGQEIDKISDLAVQETELALYIDKESLREQESIAARMSALVEAHKGNFDALGKLGKQISLKADVFSDSIKTAFSDIDHEHVRIYSESEPLQLSRCGA